MMPQHGSVMGRKWSVCVQSTLGNKEFHKSDYLRAALQRKTDWILWEICNMWYICRNATRVDKNLDRFQRLQLEKNHLGIAPRIYRIAVWFPHGMHFHRIWSFMNAKVNPWHNTTLSVLLCLRISSVLRFVHSEICLLCGSMEST